VQVTRGVNVRNIGQVVTERLNALRRLTVNPDDTSAMNAAYAAQQKVCRLSLFYSGWPLTWKTRKSQEI